MHEMSLAMEICEITRRAIGDRPAAAVTEVVVDVGYGSGIEPDNLEFCLAALLQSPPFYAARPVLRRQSGDDLRVAHVEVEECL